MAEFSGTLLEFEKFIGPRLRNIVQTSIARKLRNDVGKCQVCKTKHDLQAAHIQGIDRKFLIKQALNGCIVDNKIEKADLEVFELKFKELHNPPEKVFKILCRKCHSDYDKVTETIDTENFSVNDELLAIKNDNQNSEKQVLPIEFVPNDITEFKELLLVHKKANIRIMFNGGNQIVKEWNASNISESSDIIRNLRSRQEFRQGNWQEANINSIIVEIDEIHL